MNEQNIINYIKTNINKLSNIKDFSDNDFDKDSREFVAQLKEYGKEFSIPDLLEQAGLGCKERKAIEEACQVKESNIVTLLIKKAIFKNDEDQISKELEKLSNWFDSDNCYRVCYSREEDFQGINKEFFNRFKEYVLPHIKKENYAALFIYLKSGNLKQDILNELYKKSDKNNDIQQKVKERINELLIPIRIERKDGIIDNLIVEDSNTSFLNKKNVAKSGYIDVVMKSPVEKKLFISEVTANKIYDDIHDHIGSRDLLDPHLKILEKNSGYSIERYDFYKGLQKSFIERNIKDFNGKTELVDHLFVFLNSNVNNLVNYKNKNNIKIQMFGSDESKVLNIESDIYESFNNFLKEVVLHYNKIDPQLKTDIRKALVESSKWIISNMDLETSPQVISKYRKAIDIKNIEKCIKLFNVEGISNQNLNNLHVKIEEQEDSTPEKKAERNIKRIQKKSNENNINKERYSKESFLEKMNLNKEGIEFNFNLLEDLLLQTKNNEDLLPVYRNRAKKALNGLEVKGYSDEETLIYNTYLKFKDLGFSKMNKISYSNKKINVKEKDIYDLYFIMESLVLFSQNAYNFDFKKDGYVGNKNLLEFHEASFWERGIPREDCIKYFKELDENYNYLNIINTYFNMFKGESTIRDLEYIVNNVIKIEELNSDNLWAINTTLFNVIEELTDNIDICGIESIATLDLEKTRLFKEEIKKSLNQNLTPNTKNRLNNIEKAKKIVF